MPIVVGHHAKEPAVGVESRKQRPVDRPERLVLVRRQRVVHYGKHVQHPRPGRPRRVIDRPVPVRIVREKLPAASKDDGAIVCKVKVQFRVALLAGIVLPRGAHVRYYGVIHARPGGVDHQDRHHLDPGRRPAPESRRPHLEHRAQPVRAALRAYVVPVVESYPHVMIKRPVQYGGASDLRVERVVHRYGGSPAAPFNVQIDAAVFGHVHDGVKPLRDLPRMVPDRPAVRYARIKRAVGYDHALPIGIEHDGMVRDGIPCKRVLNVGV